MTTKAKSAAREGDTARPEKRSVEDWVLAIDGLIVKQKRTVFDIGDLLIAAEGELSKKNFQTVIKTSGLKTKKTAQNYMRVARKEILRRPGVFEKLPLSVGALIDLAAWRDFEIEWALENQILKLQTTRAQLQRFDRRFDPSPAKPPPPRAMAVGYIMCDIDGTFDDDRMDELQEQFDKIKLQCLDDDTYIARFEDLWAVDRRIMLAKRVWDAYTKDLTLFVNPAFHHLMEKEKIDENAMQYRLCKIAPLIASGDHKPLHKIIRFSKSDWKLFGVSETGYATLLSYFTADADIIVLA
jgi:hypothetical protein